MSDLRPGFSSAVTGRKSGHAKQIRHPKSVIRPRNLKDMKKNSSLSGRVYILIAVMGLWGTVIGTRLYFLHVVHSADYKERAERQQQRTLEVSPRRGNIYDRNGNELAVSIKVDSVFAVPDEIENPVRPRRRSSPALPACPASETSGQVRQRPILRLDQAKTDASRGRNDSKGEAAGHLLSEGRPPLLSEA